MTDPRAQIARMATQAAQRNLRMADARAWFEATYLAHALALERGNQTKAAERAGVCREVYARRRMGRKPKEVQEDGQ